RVRVDRVEAVLLEAIGAELVDEADAPALVAAEVDDDAALGGDRLERGVELRPALALERAEGLARQALGVEPHERRLADRVADEREVVVARAGVAVRADAELPVRRRHRRLGAERDRGQAAD